MNPSLRFDIISLFPEIVESASSVGVIGRACREGTLAVHTHQLRDFTGGSPHPIDDAPYGGGPGMVMRPEPIFEAVETLAAAVPDQHRVLMTPQGQPFSQKRAHELAGKSAILIFCGRYEGVDERVRSLFDEELSIGDYVLTGGEPAATVVVDSVGRLVPGVLGCSASSEDESFSGGTLEYPQYTRPAEFRGMGVPPVLTSGNHAAIDSWRREQSLARTRDRRPDLAAGQAESAPRKRHRD